MADDLTDKVKDMSVKDYKTYNLGDFKLQNGETLPGAFIGEKTSIRTYDCGYQRRAGSSCHGNSGFA